MNRKLVVAALIMNDRDQVLVTQRREDQDLGGFWEFPGGKVEPGEAPEAALARELMEELAVEARVGRIWDVLFHRYPSYDVYMLVYRVALAPDATPRPVEVADVRWVPRAELGAVRILPADEALVTRLVAGTD